MRSILQFTWMLLLLLNIHLCHAAHFKTIEGDLSDSIITTKITAKYTKNRLLNPLKIFVSTENGHVTLKGRVNSKEAWMNAVKLAQLTNGVKSVDSKQLNINLTNSALTDAYITAKIEATILKAKVLDDESIPLVGINASTINGVVTLTGQVKNQRAINAIIKRTMAIRGVKKVHSKLLLLPQPRHSTRHPEHSP